MTTGSDEIETMIDFDSDDSLPPAPPPAPPPAAPAPAAPRPRPAAAGYDKNHTEAAEFLGILKGRVDQIRNSPWARGEAGSMDKKIHLSEYTAFRNMISEGMTFLIIIENRLDRIADNDAGQRDKLVAIFDGLTVALWSALLKAALTFLENIALQRNMPLGAHEVFVRELKTLYDAGQSLKSPRYAGLIDAEALKNRQLAEKILNEIIDRAPALLELKP